MDPLTAPLVLRGTPRRFDSYLRPAVRALQLFVGTTGTVVLLALQLWWWAPVPLALSYVAYELFFWRRGDRPVTVRLARDGLTLHDGLAELDLRVPLQDVYTASLLHRPGPGETTDVVVQLTSRDAVFLALPFRVSPFRPRAGDVDAAAADVLLGGIAGIVRAVAPHDRVCRQVVEDPRGVPWLRSAVAREAWARTGVRVWRGEEPSLDLFGYHDTPPDGFLVLDGDRVNLSLRGERSLRSPLGAARFGRTQRTTVLFRMEGEAHDESEEVVPLLVMDLGPAGQVAVPAPALGDELPEIARTADLLHVHGPEGALVLAHVLRHAGGELPDVLAKWTPFAQPPDGQGALSLGDRR